jgi:excisionase family DNA binding protein
MKVKDAAKYSGVSERTFRDWLKDGLRHSRLRSGTILVKPASIDEYIEKFEVCESDSVGPIVKDVVAEFYR